MLYAFGYGAAKDARSIEASTLFRRCRTIVSDFTDNDVDRSLDLIRRRNEELHTGAPVFEDLPTRLWLSDYYRICSLLLQFQGKSLTDLFGAEEADAAQEMIQTAKEELVQRAAKLIGEAKSRFFKLTEEERAVRKEDADLSNFFDTDQLSKVVQCPACEAEVQISGKKISASEPRLQNDMIVRETIMLPTSLQCQSCGLKLQTYRLLDAAGLGGQYTKTESHDPLEYYREDEDAADYWDDLYGNE